MLLIKKIKDLPLELLADLHQIVEDRLIELGALDDPYELTDEERQKLDQSLLGTEDAQIDSFLEETAANAPSWETPDLNDAHIRESEEKDKLWNELCAAVGANEQKEELLEAYKITQAAAQKEAESYSASMTMTPEQWKKILAM